MILFFSRVQFALQAIALLKQGRSQCASFPDFLDSVTANCGTLSAPTRADLIWILSHRRLWMFFDRAVRANACLYLSMLLYAFEVQQGSPVEVNVTYSLDTKDIGTGGHC